MKLVKLGALVSLVVALLLVGSLSVLAYGPELTPPQQGGIVQSGGGSSATGKASNAKAIKSTPSQPAPNQGVPIGYAVSDAEMAQLKQRAASDPLAAQAMGPDLQVDNGKSAPRKSPKAPNLGTNFQGFGYTGWFPPDPTLAVGPSNLVVAVNSSWRVYDKTGAQLWNQTLSDWWGAAASYKVFDPKLIYDREAGRFLMIAAATDSAAKKSYILISVSNTSDATGWWCNWWTDFKFNGSTSTNNWGDYPQVGVNKDAVFITANMFAFGGGFQYSKLRIISKAALYDTSCPGYGYWDFWNAVNPNGSKVFTWQPALTMDSWNNEYLANALAPGGSSLTVWRVNNPVAFESKANAPAAPSLTRWSVSSAGSYAAPPNAQQLSGALPLLETGDTRLLNLESINNWLWTTHTVACKWSNDGNVNRACLRWYQINLTLMAPAQASSFGNPGLYYFYPAVMADDWQDMVVVFSRSGSSENPGTRYTGRAAWDWANSLQGSASLQPGYSSQVEIFPAGRNRWGDYGGIGLDPSSGCFWIHHEYASTTVNQWNTWVGETCWGE